MTSVSSPIVARAMNCGGGLAARRVHAHVERTVDAIGEAARRDRRAAATRRRGRAARRRRARCQARRALPGSSENHARRNTKRGSRSRAAAASASGSRSTATSRPRGAERREDRARMAAAAERARRRRRRRREWRAPRALRRAGRERARHRCVAHRSLKGSGPRGRAASRPGNVIVCAICACHFISSHSSSFWPWPTSTTRLSSPA